MRARKRKQPPAKRKAPSDQIQCLICGKWLKTVNHFHLENMHGMTVSEYKEEFNLDYVFSDSSREKAALSAKSDGSKGKYTPRSRKEVLDTLRSHAVDGEPLNISRIKKQDRSLVSQACRLFGNWHMALRAAGLDTVREKWSGDRVIKMIRDRAAKGLSLQQMYVEVEQLKLFASASRLFGNWRGAVTAAGFDYSKIRKKPVERPRERTARRLREWVEKHGPLYAKALRKTDGNLFNYTVQFFGGAARAGKKLGLPYVASKSRFERSWFETRGEVLRVTASMKKRLGKGLRKARKARKLTQPQAAELLGTTGQTVASWERGRALPQDMSMLPKVESVLGFSYSEAIKKIIS